MYQLQLVKKSASMEDLEKSGTALVRLCHPYFSMHLSPFRCNKHGPYKTGFLRTMAES